MEVYKKAMKKSIPVLLAATLAVSYGAGDVLAKGKPNHAGPPAHVQAKLKGLIDIDGYWGQVIVEKMNALGVIKGYQDGTFQPNKPVTQAEAVVMIVRLLGLEDEALKRNAAGVKLPFKNSKSIPAYAHGYIDIALELGIVPKSNNFQGNKAASRLYVTTLLVSALDVDLKDFAGKAIDFTDLAGLTAEEKLKIAVAATLELAKGYGDKTFQPNKPVTRGEMAAFLDRLKEILDKEKKDHSQHIKGLYAGVNISRNQITVKQEVTSGSRKQWEERNYTLASDYTVYYDGQRRSSFDAFKAGDTLELILNKDGKVTFVIGTPSKDTVVWEKLKDVKVFDLKLTSGSNQIHYTYDERKAKDVKVVSSINGQLRVLEGQDAVNAIRTVMDTHLKAGKQLDIEAVSKELATTVQTRNNTDATVTLNYKSVDQNMAFTVSPTTTSLNWTSADNKDKVVYSRTQATRDGRVTTKLELKDSARNREINYSKEEISTAIRVSGHITIGSTKLDIVDTTYEPTMVQFLGDMNFKLSFTKPPVQDNDIWTELKGVSTFDLQVRSGDNLTYYNYDAQKPQQIYVLRQLNNQSSTLTGKEAATSIRRVMDGYLEGNKQLDVYKMSKDLADVVRRNNAQTNVQLNYATDTKKLSFKSSVEASTTLHTMNLEQGNAKLNYALTTSRNNVDTIQFTFKDNTRAANYDIEFKKVTNRNNVTIEGSIKLNGTTLSLEGEALETFIVNLLKNDYKINIAF